jgi:hypothetical protein
MKEIACSTRSCKAHVGCTNMIRPVTSGENTHTKKKLCVLSSRKKKFVAHRIIYLFVGRRYKKMKTTYAASSGRVYITRRISLHTHALQNYRHMGHRNHLQSHAWPVSLEAALFSI